MTTTTEWTEADQKAILEACLNDDTLQKLILGIPRERLQAVIKQHAEASYEEEDTVFFTTRVMLEDGQSFLITTTTSTLKGVAIFKAYSANHTIDKTIEI